MLKTIFGSMVLLVCVASGLSSCGSSSTSTGTGGTSGSAGGTGGRGGAAGGTAGTGGGAGGAPGTGSGGAGGSSQTGDAGSTTGDAGATGDAASLTLAQACTKNCSLAAGLNGCSTTMDVCVQSCLKTYDNTSAINPVLGTKYTKMMICVATNSKFASSADFVCAKPDRALNKWSPGPDSTCETAICDWNCSDGTMGNFDPFVDIRCACSSV